MLDNALALTIDCQYPAPTNLTNYQKKYNYSQSYNNKFELVFDQREDGDNIKSAYEKEGITSVIQEVGDDDENYESGQQDNC